jgi:hypothetical protein
MVVGDASRGKCGLSEEIFDDEWTSQDSNASDQHSGLTAGDQGIGLCGECLRDEPFCGRILYVLFGRGSNRSYRYPACHKTPSTPPDSGSLSAHWLHPTPASRARPFQAAIVGHRCASPPVTNDQHELHFILTHNILTYVCGAGPGCMGEKHPNRSGRTQMRAKRARPSRTGTPRKRRCLIQSAMSTIEVLGNLTALRPTVGPSAS